ncbi:MAG: hypothetical protein WDZ82_03675 [Candidatus Paceibacterota bacterium]
MSGTDSGDSQGRERNDDLDMDRAAQTVRRVKAQIEQGTYPDIPENHMLEQCLVPLARDMGYAHLTD